MIRREKFLSKVFILFPSKSKRAPGGWKTSVLRKGGNLCNWLEERDLYAKWEVSNVCHLEQANEVLVFMRKK